MNKLKVQVKTNLPNEKGQSKYQISVLITQKDIDNFEIPQALLGEVLTGTPAEWGAITYPNEPYHGKRRILSRCITAVKDYRDPRQIAGLDPLIVKNTRNSVKKPRVALENKQKVINNWFSRAM